MIHQREVPKMTDRGRVFYRSPSALSDGVTN